MENFSTEELINIFQNASNPNREAAFTELVIRFREKILKLCEIRCKRFNQEVAVAEELAITVFEKYFLKGNFRHEESKGKNIDDSFVLYLLGIAKHELTNIFRKQKRKQEGKWSNGSEKIVTELPKKPRNQSIESKITFEILENLPYKHLVIYLTYKSYENAGATLPRHLLQQLRDHLEISQITIRAYKKEVLDKINDALKLYQSYNFTQNE